MPEKKVTLKAKVNNKYDVAFLFKRALWGYEDLATFSFGFGVNGALSDKRSINHGVQLDFNIWYWKYISLLLIFVSFK